MPFAPQPTWQVMQQTDIIWKVMMDFAAPLLASIGFQQALLALAVLSVSVAAIAWLRKG